MHTPCTLNKTDWPVDVVSVLYWRQQTLLRFRRERDHLYGAKEFYKTHPVEFINHWFDTYDPRKAAKSTLTTSPFVLFERQDEYVRFLYSMLQAEENGLVEKCRDVGATWVSCAFSVWLWLFMRGAAIGWGSRKEALIDRIDDPDSIFEKMRRLIRSLPQEFLPAGFDPAANMAYMRIVNPENDATITGEAGDNIGRGGRKLIYFKDESAHYERPEKIEAALADNTRVQIDISSVNGVGNVFHRRREAGEEWLGGAATKNVTNIFVFDWSDHPEKTQDWYDMRRRKAADDGLLHLFAQEVDRNYAASVVGSIIPVEWIKSAVDAHIVLEFVPSDNRIAGLDVADEGGDKNALAQRLGSVLISAEDWSEGDTGKTARRAITALGGPASLQYDSIGVGAGVKAEANRLSAEGLMPRGVVLTAWTASAGPQDANDNIEPGDPDTPLNRDFYANLKSQGWWQLRRRFEKTHRAVTEGVVYSQDELISLLSSLPRLRQIEKELSQATVSRSAGALKLIVNKSPKGAKSPNIADAIVMAFWPVVPEEAYVWNVGGRLIAAE